MPPGQGSRAASRWALAVAVGDEWNVELCDLQRVVEGVTEQDELALWSRDD